MNNDLKNFAIDAQDVSAQHLRQMKICPGFLFLAKKYGEPILLKSPGDYIDENFIHKFEGTNRLKIYLSGEFDSLFKELLLKIKASKTYSSEMVGAERLLQLFYEVYWQKESKFGLSDLIFACYSSLNRYQNKQLDELFATQKHLVSRSLITASMNIIHCISFGHFNFQFLQDIFNVSLLATTGYLKEKYSISYESELNKKRSLKDSSMIEFKELELKNSFNVFTHSQISTVIQFIWENPNASRSPLSLTRSDLCDWQSIIALTNHILPFQAYRIDEMTGHDLVKLYEDFSSSKLIEISGFFYEYKSLMENLHLTRKRIEEGERKRMVVNG